MEMNKMQANLKLALSVGRHARIASVELEAAIIAAEGAGLTTIAAKLREANDNIVVALIPIAQEGR